LQHGEEVSRASTAPSISSVEEEEGRLESSGGAELRVMDVELKLLRNKTNQWCEKVHRAKVEGMGERGKVSGSQSTADSSGRAHRYGGLRRAISSSWRRLGRERKGGAREEVEGVL
jgi:hypothetical protein